MTRFGSFLRGVDWGDVADWTLIVVSGAAAVCFAVALFASSR